MGVLDSRLPETAMSSPDPSYYRRKFGVVFSVERLKWILFRFHEELIDTFM
jgi:hypothetical protein